MKSIQIYTLLLGVLVMLGGCLTDSNDSAEEDSQSNSSSSSVAPGTSSAEGTGDLAVALENGVLYDAGEMGQAVFSGGTWRVFGDQGNQEAQNYSCELDEFSTDNQAGDFANGCINGERIDIGFDVSLSEDDFGNTWGIAGVTADFYHGHEDALPGEKTPLDLSEYAGVCISYSSVNESVKLGVKTTLDQDGDFYSVQLPSAGFIRSLCFPFNTFEKSAWSTEFDLNPALITGLVLQYQSEGSFSLELEKISVYKNSASSGSGFSETLQDGLVYDATTMQNTLFNGSEWMVFGQQGNGEELNYSCGGLNFLTDIQIDDFADRCVDNGAIDVNFDIRTSEDDHGNVWAMAGLEVYFHSGHTDAQPVDKTPWDLSAYEGICITYASPGNNFMLALSTTLDRDGDSYAVSVSSRSDLGQSCFDFSEFDKNAWSNNFDFNLTEATGIKLFYEREGNPNLRVQNISLY